jgi:Trypsin-like peptidase domain
LSKAVEKNWIRSTCRIRNDRGAGTGFFLNDTKKKRIFLVTNKHVIHSYKKERDSIREVLLDINIIDNNGQTKKDEVSYSFDNGSYREHKDPDTDVYILYVTGMFITLLKEHNVKPNHFAAPLDCLLTDEAMRKNEIKITDEVFLIGYPSTNNLQHHTTNFPFVRQGMIASNIGELLEDDFHGEELQEDKSKPKRRRVMKAFLIDGGIMPGLSGSPVILKPTMFRELEEGRVADYFPPLILGLVAETRMAFLAEHYRDIYYSYANLGLAFDAETITETINLFYI